jgi:3-hydroxyacyl-CoA dehydrogenase
VNYHVAEGVAVLTIANPPVNALSLPVREALLAALRRAEADPAVRALVLTGAGGMFAAGADLNEVASGLVLKPPITRDVQAQMESLTKPLVAAIEGLALGGGFELALTCHWRLAGGAAKVGLPEVKLGLIPGAGGTQRFTRLAGPEAALEAITSGTALPAARAQQLGLVDQVADPVLPAAVVFALRAAAEKPPLRIASEVSEHIRAVPAELFSAFRTKIEPKARGQLAPWRIIDAIEAACTRPKEEAQRLEREYFIECRDSPQRRALLHVFFAEREARKIPGIPSDLAPLPIRRAGVIGAGTMGGGIAMTFANAGIPVALLDQSPEALERGLALIRKNYAVSVSRGSLPQGRAEQALALIRGVGEYGALKDADILIEAVFETLKVKQQVFAQLDAVAAPHAILASNTSTLDIDAIAASTSRPQQVVGTHFFSPANVMKLLENVRGSRTAPEVIATVMALGKTLGKVPVLAGNCDGFIGNRMLAFYGLEAEFLLEEGATPEQIDRVIEGFGFAMGPLAVRDLAGNDVGFLIRQGRTLPADERWSPILERLVADGRLGQKAGKGFYRYEGRTRIPDPQVVAIIEGVSRDLNIQRRDIADEEILRRLLHPLVNEGARIVEEGIALRAGDVDTVYINGYGFPAWRGGPMYWAEQCGLEHVVRTMQTLARTHGARWQPAPLLTRLAAAGQGWSA